MAFACRTAGKSGRRSVERTDDRGNAMKRIYVVGTADTKGEELAFLADAIAAAGAAVAARRCRHARRRPCRSTLPQRSRRPSSRWSRQPCSASTTAAARSRRWAPPSPASSQARDDIAGIIGIGGGGGTSIVTAGMRALPLGLPKIMVSTLASGDVAPYVDVSDIVMMPSVTDMAGLNRLSPRRPAQRRAGDRRHGGKPAPPRPTASRRSASPCSASPRPA